MNIETVVSEPLRRAVKDSYERRDFTAAIMDAIYFLGDAIRERSGLDSDGVALIGQAFGGKSPMLKVNRLETESERNVQEGVESMLRGIYKAIRNPRSHEKHEDTQQDADAIILFVDYLLSIIGKSTTPFTIPDFLTSIFDPDFVESKRYAALLAAKIPERRRFEVFIEAYRLKETGDAKKLGYFFKALFDVMSEEDRKRALEAVTAELETTQDESTIRLSIQLIPAPYWEHFPETVRLRVENKLIKSVAQGKYSAATNKCLAGAFGTWISSLFNHMLLKDEFIGALASKITGTAEEREYAFQYLLFSFLNATHEPDDYLVMILEGRLQNGDARLHKALRPLTYGKSLWLERLKPAYEGFKEAQIASSPETDEVPF